MRSLTIAFLLFSHGIANASYFEFCALTGHISSEPIARDGGHYFSFHVTSTAPAQCKLGESYRPQECAGYQGKQLEVGLPITDVQLPQRDAALTIIQLVWYAEILPDPGFRVTWKLPGECQAVSIESAL